MDFTLDLVSRASLPTSQMVIHCEHLHREVLFPLPKGIRCDVRLSQKTSQIFACHVAGKH